MHGNGWFNDLRAEALPSARSHDGLASARTPFASSCGAWDGKAPYRFRQSCPLRRSRVRTQTCPVLRPLLPRHDRQLRRMVRTQTCPLCLPLPEQEQRSASTLIRVIGAPTDCWHVWGYWRMRLRCLVLRLRFRVREFCWPCPFLSPAASSSVRKGSTAVLGQPSMDCAPVCSHCCSWRSGASNGPRV